MFLSLTIGLGILALSFFILAFQLDQKHVIIKVISLIFGVLMLLVLANHLLVTQDDCQMLLNRVEEVYIYGDNYTGYHYDYYVDYPNPSVTDMNLFHRNITYNYTEVCLTYGGSSGLSAFKVITYFIRIFQAYIFLFILYFIFDVMGFNLFHLAQRAFKK